MTLLSLFDCSRHLMSKVQGEMLNDAEDELLKKPADYTHATTASQVPCWPGYQISGVSFFVSVDPSVAVPKGYDVLKRESSETAQRAAGTTPFLSS
jgi:hypothetical protein